MSGFYDALDKAHDDLDAMRARTGDICAAFSGLQIRRLAKRFGRSPIEVVFAMMSKALAANIVADSELLDIFERDMGVSTTEHTGGAYIQLAHYFQLPAVT